ncbi:MAG: DUF222 domain-containing protein [Gammaproteobacteria bacterium]|nr:DUF222 domain-containing protein [Gammaproteobacteria bacterium]
MDTVTNESTDRIETDLIEIETTIGRLRAVQADLLCEIDRRQTPTADACRSLAEWVASRLDVAPETAQALTRITRSDTNEVNEALANGDVSFDRAVELTRLATVAPHDNLVERSQGFDIAGLRRRIAHHRRITPSQEHDAFTNRHLVMQPNLDESTWRLWGTLPGYEGAIVDRALTERADRFPPLPDGTRPTISQRKADALVAVCNDTATGTETGHGPVVTIFVDATQAAATNGQGGVTIASGPRVGPRTLQAILCEGSIEVTATTKDGQILGIGNRTATIAPRVRRYVLYRDQGCTADGCTSQYRLQPHHINWRASGADNDPDNLTTLCWYHHHVIIHRLGYRIDPDTPPQRRRFLKPPHDPDPP